MFRKIAIALGLAMVAGTSLAAGHSPAGIDIGIDSNIPVDAQFNMLDRNGDGIISRTEAQASPELSAMFDGFDTSATIDDETRGADLNSITPAQFRAGLKALAAGAVGPAASGGGTYVLMKNGSWVRRDKAFQKPARSDTDHLNPAKDQ